MKHIAWLTAMAIMPLLTSALSAAEVKVVVPAGSLIETHLSQAMSSSDTHTGDLFEFAVSTSVIGDGLVVIPAGSKGVGHVTEAHSAGSHGKSGGLRLAFDYVFAEDGTQLPVSHNKEAEEKDRSTALATGLGILTFGVGGLFFHNFVHGSDVTLSDTAITFVSTLANKAVILDSEASKAPIAGSSPEPNAPPSALPSPSPTI